MALIETWALESLSLYHVDDIFTTPLPSTRNHVLALCVAAVMAASVWLYFQRILIPYQIADAAAHHRPRGILSDLYPRWHGARELLLNGKDPYGEEVTREIQTGYYGRPIDRTRPDDPRDEQRFAYPVYVVFYLAPFIKLPFSTVRWLCIWGLGALTGLSVCLWLRAIRWKLSGVDPLVALLLTLSSLAAVQGIKLQQLSLLVAPLLAICYWLIAEEKFIPAGICLGLATVKPQATVLSVLWLTLWVFARWHQRQKLFWSFAATLLVLFTASELILPGWFAKFVDGVVAYQHYANGSPSVLFGAATAAGLEILCCFALLAIGWRSRATSPGSKTFSSTAAFVLTFTVLLFSIVAPYNQVLLIPAVLLIVRYRCDLWSRHRASRTMLVLAALLVLWPWITSLVLAPASFIVSSAAIQKTWAVPMWTSIGVPIIILPLVYMLWSDSVSRESTSPIPTSR